MCSEWAVARKVVGWFAAAAAVVFVVVVVSETADVVRLADAVHSVFGQVVLWVLLTVYVALVAVPVVMVLRLPKAVPLPDPDDTEAVDAYRDHMQNVLEPAAVARGIDISAENGLNEVVTRLDTEANAAILEAARAVFASTAISQSGRLDALAVLTAQTRMIWRIAHIYRQRPGVRDMWQLYTNVLATSLAAVQIEDLELEEQLEPMISVILGGAAGAVPGLKTVTDIIVASLMDGAANGFLTLRVGVVARMYCGAFTTLDRRATRRSATREAASMLGTVLKDAAPLAGHAAKALGKNAWRKTKGGFTGMWNSLAGMFRRSGEGETPENEADGRSETGFDPKSGK